MRPLLLNEGVITLPQMIIDRLFSMILTTDKSRSTLSVEDPESLAYVLKSNTDNMSATATEFEKILQRKYLKYADSVESEVRAVAISDTGYYNLIVKVTIYSDGRSYDLQECIRVEDAVTFKILK